MCQHKSIRLNYLQCIIHIQLWHTTNNLGKLSQLQREINKKKRVLSEYFKDNQRIQHIIGINKEWVGTYSLNENVIKHEDVNYDTLSKFVEAHYKKEQPNSSCKAQGWIECKYEVDGQWVEIKKNQ